MADVTVSQLMRSFARRTGLVSGDAPPKRYLWTDAFAVFNFLGLFVEQGDEEALLLARRLVDQVHHVLGKHRPDDPRHGWISGLDAARGAQHPTAGGLRIGKRLPERGPQETFDPDLEWERDGQYFHYLTKWMQALHCMTRVTGDPAYHCWALQLAKVAFVGFSAPRQQGLYWKMSIDLSRPQVPSMGHHDPLDGLLTYAQLRANGRSRETCDIDSEIDELARFCAGRTWETDDPLGLGGLLCDALRAARLLVDGGAGDPTLPSALLAASLPGLERMLRQRPFQRRTAHRLAFREFGLSIGLHAVERLRERFDLHALDVSAPGLSEILPSMFRYLPLAPQIEGFWCDPSNRATPGWQAHRDINDVMLATSLAPGAFLSFGD